MSITRKLQVPTTHIGINPENLSTGVETIARPLPATLKKIGSLSLPTQATYSQLCFESEAGSWVSVGVEQLAEVGYLAAIGLVEVAA